MYMETIKSMVFRELNIIRCHWIQYHFTVHNIPELGQQQHDASLVVVQIPA